jgi:hypothetical protein
MLNLDGIENRVVLTARPNPVGQLLSVPQKVFVSEIVLGVRVTKPASLGQVSGPLLA